MTGEHALPVTIMATSLFSSLVQLFALFVLFRKTVARTDKIVNNKGPRQVSPYSDNAFFRNKAANSGLRAAQPNCSENRFIEKKNKISHVLFWNIARDDLSYLPLGSPPCRMI